MKRIIIILTTIVFSSCAAFGLASAGLTDIILDGCDNSVLIAYDCLIDYSLEEEYDPVASGEVDPWEVYEAEQMEEYDKAMAEEAQKAWAEQYEQPYDISDSPIKP